MLWFALVPFRSSTALQLFMFINDSVMVAIEVPIWLTEADISTLEDEHGVSNSRRVTAQRSAITGRIDFVQIRNGAIHVLDSKPAVRTNRPIAQLAIYACALTRRAPELKLFDIKCAWFNEEEYCKFFPRLLVRDPH